MRWLKLTLAYDGSNFAGWQVQPQQRTVQDTFQRTLEKITGESICVVASGRTDSGVHAEGQVVSFPTQSKLETHVLLRALNAELPKDVLVRSVEEAPEGFHAIRDAVRKRYRYHMHDGTLREVFRRAYVWQWHKRLDDQAMHRSGQSLLGKHDFSSFESLGAPREHSIRTVSELTVCRGQGERSDWISIDVVADGFLYNMVRAIVGTLVEVGRGAQAESWPSEILRGQDRSKAGMTAPPQRLFLIQVDY